MADYTRAQVAQALQAANAAGDADAVKTLQDYLDRNPDLPTGPDTVSGALASGARGALSSVALGFDDELAGLARAIVPGGLDYQQGRDQARISRDQLQAQYPKAFMAGELGGGLVAGAGGIAKGGAMLAARGMKPLAANASIGALEGGLYGVGSAGDNRVGEGLVDPGEALASGTIGAVAGGTLGAALPPILRASGNMGAAAAPMARRLMFENTQEAAERQLGGYLKNAGYSADTIAQRARENPAMLLANLDQGTRTLGHRAARESLEGGNLAREALDAQRRGAYGRLDEAVTEAMPAAGDYGKTLDSLQAFYQRGAKSLYDQAYALDVGMTPGMARDWDTDYVQKAVEYAQNRGRNLPGGSDMRTLPNQVNTRFAHDMLRNLSDQADAAFRRGEGNLGSDIADIRNNMRKEILAQNPDFAAAQRMYRGAKETENALGLGRDLLKGKKYSDDVERLRRDFSQAEEDAFQTGVLRSMREAVLDVTATGNTGAKLFKNERVKQLLDEAIADPATFRKLIQTAANEQEMAEYGNRMLRNSPTAEAMMGGRPEFPDIPPTTATGGVLYGLKKIFDHTMNRKLTPQEWAEMSKILFNGVDEGQVARMLSPLNEQGGPVGRAVGMAVPLGLLGGAYVAMGDE